MQLKSDSIIFKPLAVEQILSRQIIKHTNFRA